jgi:hypothetical protein
MTDTADTAMMAASAPIVIHFIVIVLPEWIVVRPAIKYRPIAILRGLDVLGQTGGNRAIGHSRPW